MEKSKLSRRAFLHLATATSAGALVAACAPLAGPQATPGDGAAAAATPLIYWNYMTNVEELESEILQSFQSAHSEINLSYEYVPWQQYWEKLNATLAAGNPPDVWNTAPTFYYEYILRNQLADLSDLIEQNIDMSDFHATALSGYDFRNRYYGIPRNIVTTVVYFNKTIFAEAGVEPPPLDGNWTWSDMLEKAKAITKDENGDGKPEVWGAPALQHAWWLDEVIMGNGGEVFLGEFSRDLTGMTANYDSEIARSTYQYFVDLIHQHKVSYQAGEFEGMGSPFMTGKVGMVYDLNWGPHTYREAPFEWDLTMIPKGSVEQLTYGGADGLVVSQPTQALDASWQLIGWLIDPATGGAFLTESGAMPVVNTEQVTNDYLQTFPDKNIQALVDSAAIARNTFTLGFNEWKRALQTELEQAYLGQKPVDQMVVDANNAVNAAIERIRTEFREAIGG
jgi:multiple sugar transport system substrate-binding protein